MGRSQITFNKKEREKKKAQKRKAKAEKREFRKDQESSGKLEDTMAYVDEFGNIVDTPPEERKPAKEVESQHGRWRGSGCGPGCGWQCLHCT